MTNEKTEKNSYPFRGPVGQVVWMDFAAVMDTDVMGRVVIDGIEYRRARDLEPRPEKRKAEAGRPVYLSDSMGFLQDDLGNRLEHLKRSGVRGIEFKRDPDVPQFFQIQADSEAAKMRYAKSLNMRDYNSRNGSAAGITGQDIESAKALVLRQR